jgi:hypothetical protein
VLNRIADTTTSVPSGSGVFTALDNVSIGGSTVAFHGTASAQQGVYSSTGGLLRVANLATGIPNGTGAFSSFNQGVSTSEGNIVFEGAGSSLQDGIYSTNNGLHRVASTSTPIPGGGGVNFQSFNFPSASGSEVAFYGSGSGQQGIYTDAGGTLHAVANTQTNIPNTAIPFTGFINRTALNNGNVAFYGFGSSLGGIYTNVGGALHKVVDTATSVPGGTGVFTTFNGGPALNNGSVAFTGIGSGVMGIFSDLGGTLGAVATDSTFLDGRRISSFPNGVSAQGLSNGNVAFVATLEGSGPAVYVAEQSYDYTANASGSWDTASNWSFGLKPRAAVPTNIHPTNGSLITGPATSTTIRVLDLGSTASGQAELRLQSSAQLSVNEYAYIQDRGKLNLNGSTLSAGGMYNYGEIDLAGGQTSGGFLSNVGILHGSGTVGNDVGNFGRIEAINTQTRFTGHVDNSLILDIDNQPILTGQIDVRSALVQFGGGLSNQSQLNFSFGTSDVFGTVENLAADGPTPGGQVIVSGNSNVTFYNKVVHNGAVFRVSAGSTAIFFGPVNGAGAFTGTGSKVFEGGYSPGNSPASVSLEGPVQFTATNTLKIELGGTTVGTQYDKVSVNGGLALGGTLQIALINAFAPAIGNTFDILDWGTRSGAFSAVQFPALPPSEAWNAMQLYTAGTLSVVDSNLLPGDFNRDHQVTAADIPAMLKALTNLSAYQAEKSLTPSQLIAIGDLDLSGAITNRDIQLLLDIVPTLAGSGSLAAVPEPSAWTLAATCLLGLAVWARAKANTKMP